jgi:hypothetical protein
MDWSFSFPVGCFSPSGFYFALCFGSGKYCGGDLIHMPNQTLQATAAPPGSRAAYET